MISLQTLDSLTPEQRRTVRIRIAQLKRLEELQQLIQARGYGLRYQPNTCAVCGIRSYLGPLCFDHMDRGRSMMKLYRDYIDKDRRDLHRIEDFLEIQYLQAHPLELYKGKWCKDVVALLEEGERNAN